MLSRYFHPEDMDRAEYKLMFTFVPAIFVSEDYL